MGLVGGSATAALAAGPNYATSEEKLYVVYHGYVQVQALYSDSGRHAKNGWLRYYIPTAWDTGKKYTANTASPTSKAIKSRSYIFQDSLDWNLPATQFHFGFNWW